MALQEMLDRYCLARSRRLVHEQVGLANALVDEYIPELISRLGQVTLERNAALVKARDEDGREEDVYGPPVSHRR